jgi:hypothetical protein
MIIVFWKFSILVLQYNILLKKGFDPMFFLGEIFPIGEFVFQFGEKFMFFDFLCHPISKKIY